MSAAEISVRTVTRRRARATTSSVRIVDGLLVMVLLAMSAICYSYYHQMRAQLDAARLEHSRAAAVAQALEIENARISAEIEALQRDPEAIESAARQYLGMVRPGETVLTISRPGSQH